MFNKLNAFYDAFKQYICCPFLRAFDGTVDTITRII